MKKFKVEIATLARVTDYFWDSDMVPDTVPAENKEEAFELAKQYLLDTGTPEKEFFNLIFRITDIDTDGFLIKGGWEND